MFILSFLTISNGSICKIFLSIKIRIFREEQYIKNIDWSISL